MKRQTRSKSRRRKPEERDRRLRALPQPPDQPKGKPSEGVMAAMFNTPCRVVIMKGTDPPEPIIWHDDLRIWTKGLPALRAAVAEFIGNLEDKKDPYSTSFKDNVSKLVYYEAIQDSRLYAGTSFDANLQVVGLPFGKVYDLLEDRIRPGEKSDHVLMHTAVTPLDGDTPAFDRFMQQFTCGNEELERYIWRLIGYTLVGGGSEEIAVLLKGEGANGKGTLISILMDICGDYAALLQHDFFKSSAERRHQTEMAALHQKRLLANPESADGKWIVQRFKTITGEKHVMANRMRQDPTLITIVGCLWAGVNKTPILDGGRAMERRLRVIPCNMKLADDEIDPAVKNVHLPNELPQIMRRALEEAAAYLREGLLPTPECVEDESADFVENSAQPLDVWLSECTVEDEHAEETAKDLLASAKAWFEKSEYGWTVNAQTLGRFLKDNGLQSRRTKTARYWKGRRLIDG